MRMFEYRARLGRLWVIVTLLAISGTRLGAQAPRPVPADFACAPPKPQSVVLTVQGGGSLGVYEGGMTWAFVEIFKRRTALQDGTLLGSEQPGDSLLRCLPLFTLAAATGSSSGSINAFLAASDWCDQRLATRPDSSSFWLAWVNTGVEQLLPRSDEGRREKGVFAREHFRRNIFPALENGYWKESRWKPDCNVAFGAAITRLRADSFPIGAIYARTQRYASTFDVTGDARDGEPPHLRARKADVTKPEMGSVVALQGGDSTIAIKSAFDILEASSGYPLMFATKPLSVCRSANRCDPCASTISLDGCADRTEFLDGGVFDNSPLALAFALGRNPAGPPIAVYLTPENRRHQGFGPVATTLTPHMRQRTAKSDSVISDGLNELIVLAPELVSTARAYELQIASRMLPGSQRELMLERENEALVGQVADLSNRQADVTRRADSLARHNAALISETRFSRAAAAYLSQRVDSLQRELDYSRGALPADSVIRPVIVVAADDSISRSARLRELMFSVRQASVNGNAAPPGVDTFALRPTLTGEAVDQSVPPVSAVPNVAHGDSFVAPVIRETGRFHPIAGEWLAGFGAFLGRPLREYDFYVGVYDAFMVVARNTRCQKAAPADLPRCVQNAVRDLLRAGVVSIGPIAERLVNGLYASEFDGPAVWSEGELTPLPRTDSTHYLILDEIRRAMLAPGREECADRSLLAAQMCRDRITAAFEALRENGSVMALLEQESHSSACDAKAELSVSVHCGVEPRFLAMVKDPEGRFDVLARQVLTRLEETTPRGGVGAKAVDMMSLFYYSTNDRDRRGIDMGALSLPSYLPLKWRPVWLLPSSVTYTRKAGSVDLGWEVRQHVGTLPFAVATPMRLDFSHLGEYGGQGNPTRVILGGRLDLKNCFPGCLPDSLPLLDMLPSALVSRISYEWDFWWRYTSTHPWTPSGQWPYTGMSHGVDLLLLGGKIEMSVMTVPRWLRGQGLVSSKIFGTPVFVRLGAADINGMLYWLSKMMLM